MTLSPTLLAAITTVGLTVVLLAVLEAAARRDPAVPTGDGGEDQQ